MFAAPMLVFSQFIFEAESTLSVAQAPWEAFKLDMRDLFLDKLSKYPALSFWRTNSPTHFGGHTGTYTGIEEASPSTL